MLTLVLRYTDHTIGLLAQAWPALDESGEISCRVTDAEGLDAMHDRLRVLLGHCGVRLDGIYACPHHPEGTVPRYRSTCRCRKPAPGMLHQAAHDLGIDLTLSWTVGDSACDIGAGRRAGTRTALVSTRALHDTALDAQCTTTSEALCEVLGVTTSARRGASCSRDVESRPTRGALSRWR